MLVVGLTGGIGSGKSTIAKLLEKYSISVYYSDDRAKFLMQNSQLLKKGLILEFGNEVYNDDGLNREYLSKIVFNDKSKLGILNSLVHPVVANDFDSWKNKQNTKIVVKEAAILFESGAYLKCDLNINVSVDVEERIKRVVNRDGVSKKQVLARINNQWTDEQRNKQADIILENTDFDLLEDKVKQLVKQLEKKKEA
jgi:dephospho-CoA kinase